MSVSVAFRAWKAPSQKSNVGSGENDLDVLGAPTNEPVRIRAREADAKARFFAMSKEPRNPETGLHHRMQSSEG